MGLINRIATAGLVACIASCSASQALGDPVNAAQVRTAQLDMLARVFAAAEKYADRIGMGKPYINFCQRELDLKTYQHPANGSIPFGVNYLEIKDREELDKVLAVRENYERTFLVLCLANAKNSLAQAEQG